MRIIICLLVVAMLIPATLAAANPSAKPPADLESRRKALKDMLNERWEYTMRTNPIYASILGDKRYNDKVDDFSQKAIDADLEQSRLDLARFEAVDTTGFPEQEALNKQLMVRDLQISLEGARFKPWEMPVNQGSGIHIDAFFPLKMSKTMRTTSHGSSCSRFCLTRLSSRCTKAWLRG
jgi:uncharacterized protein (DUF885 family)